MIKKAEEYAKSITKNETYQKYLINAFIEGRKNLELQKYIEEKIDFYSKIKSNTAYNVKKELEQVLNLIQ